MAEFFVKHWDEILQATLEHIWLVGVAMALAIAIGVPLGILITRRPWLSKPILGSANVAETIPSLALFGFLLPVPWLGVRADRLAIVALTLYALLPIIRNTVTGISGVDPAVREAARAMGMTGRQILFHVELPLSVSLRVDPFKPDRVKLPRIGVPVLGHIQAYIAAVGDDDIAMDLDLDAIEIVDQVLFVGDSLEESRLIIARQWFAARGPGIAVNETEVAGEHAIDISHVAAHDRVFYPLFERQHFRSRAGGVRGRRRLGLLA